MARRVLKQASLVWIFEIAQNLTMSSATDIVLVGGALPRNVSWQVGGGVTLGSNAHPEGVVLAKTAISLKSAASVHGACCRRRRSP
jgi:ice-binding like protein